MPVRCRSPPLQSGFPKIQIGEKAMPDNSKAIAVNAYESDKRQHCVAVWSVFFLFTQRLPLQRTPERSLHAYSNRFCF